LFVTCHPTQARIGLMSNSTMPIWGSAVFMTSMSSARIRAAMSGGNMPVSVSPTNEDGFFFDDPIRSPSTISMNLPSRSLRRKIQELLPAFVLGRLICLGRLPSQRFLRGVSNSRHFKIVEVLHLHDQTAPSGDKIRGGAVPRSSFPRSSHKKLTYHSYPARIPHFPRHGAALLV